MMNVQDFEEYTKAALYYYKSIQKIDINILLAEIEVSLLLS
jgi:hypothetical protein